MLISIFGFFISFFFLFSAVSMISGGKISLFAIYVGRRYVPTLKATGCEFYVHFSVKSQNNQIYSPEVRVTNMKSEILVFQTFFVRPEPNVCTSMTKNLKSPT